MPGKFSCSRARQSRDLHQMRVCSKASISHPFGCLGEAGGGVSPGRGTGRTQKSCDLAHACKPELGIFWPVAAFRLLAHLHPGLIFEPHYSVRGGAETQLNWMSTEDFQKLHFFASLFRWSNYLEMIRSSRPHQEVHASFPQSDRANAKAETRLPIPSLLPVGRKVIRDFLSTYC